MRKLLVVVAIFAVLFSVVACKSTPDEAPPELVEAAPAPPPPPPPPAPVPPAPERERISSLRVGQIEVHVLVDSERDGNTNIIPDASEAILSRYIPAAGFKHPTNAFLIRNRGQNILIDTGFGNAIFEKLEELRVRPEDINAILLTHLHGDHIGGLQRDGRPLFPRATIYLDNRELEHFTRIAPNQGVIDALNAYGQNVVTFDAAPLGFVFREIVPGVSAIANYGHTPGHTVYMVSSGRGRLLITGDFLHVALVQFPHPEISATFDMNQAAAAASRRQILEYAARLRIPIGGMHIVYPGIGNVEADGNGFRFIPIQQ